MRNILRSGLSGGIAAVGYSLLVKFALPPLEQRHMLVLWWLTLGLYLALLFAYGFRSVWRAKPGLVGTGCLLLTLAAYSYDSTIQPHLASIGLGWVWMPLIGGVFLWLPMFATSFRKRDQNKSN